MARSHVRAGVKPEQYPLVGELSLDAIKEILNPPEEVLKAWEKAYNYLTKILREKEQK
ncbi:globin domain-containing protein [Saccharolobus islandicus]|uniref:Flavohemoprotein n=2 Tax=Saccharolobus islandicus TaxID=43080 RepID=C4KDV6_SACI6|nr:globin domain-containing protein [Sulfolobus islandicus]ACP54439.1 flavohemoprotein [Sulfolobus islandicus M.16.27]ACR41079.1 flavohemoprotein [Sulfolobus islandicus M.16.4]